MPMPTAQDLAATNATASPEDSTLEITDSIKVYRDPIGWAYSCKDPKCALTAGGTKWHALAGFTTRALAVDQATEHVNAVRDRTPVIA